MKNVNKNVAIVTGSHDACRVGSEDELIRSALAKLGVTSEIKAWDDPSVEWNSFDLAVIRSTWDYTSNSKDFLSWANEVSKSTRLLNPPDVITWNADKHYLGELIALGVPVVPTNYIEAGEEWVLPDFEEYVIKPITSAQGRNSGRFVRGRDDAKAAELANLVLQPGCEVLGRKLETGRALIVQPFIETIDSEGEKGFVVLGGKLSHAIRKEAVLASGGGTNIAPGTRGAIKATEWNQEEEAFVKEVLAQAPVDLERCAYARVDAVRNSKGELVLMELELVEPRLFFDLVPDALDRFASILHEQGDDFRK